MRPSTYLLMACLLAGACGNSSPEPTEKTQQLASLCIAIVEADPAARPNQIRSGMLAKTCECYAASVAKFDANTQRTHVAAWEAMTALRIETGMNGVEALGVEMMSRINAAPDAYEFSAGEFSEIGRFVGNIGNQVEASGECPRD